MAEMERTATNGQEHITRRDVLRRAAVVGAATVWAVPAVQRLGMVTAAATSPFEPPPPPPPPPTVGSFHGISYVGLVFACNGDRFRVKWEEGAASGGWSDADGDSLPQCPEPSGWSSAEVYPSPSNIVVSKTYIGGELYSVTFTLPVGCTASNGAGVTKGANPSKTGYCLSGTVGADPRVVTFTAPTT